MKKREYWNGCRYLSEKTAAKAGHYESWFQRANHPSKPLAFWIRYTIFSPRKCPDKAVGELWAIYFDGEQDRIIAAREEFPLSDTEFSESCLEHRIGESKLNSESLQGKANGSGHKIGWDLRYCSPDPHLLFLPEMLYRAPFPKAKSLVGSPLAVFTGTLNVDGNTIDIDQWVGSQNHNWGSKHTDKYAWGQVAGFDNDLNAFFEIATARVQLGPIWTPWMTLMVLRIEGKEYRLNSIPQSVRADGQYDYFCWRFESSTREICIAGSIAAPSESFVGLPYQNPPGGTKTCLNSKLAHCNLTIRFPGEKHRSLHCENRAAFEILTDDEDHGIYVLRNQSST